MIRLLGFDRDGWNRDQLVGVGEPLSGTRYALSHGVEELSVQLGIADENIIQTLLKVEDVAFCFCFDSAGSGCSQNCGNFTKKGALFGNIRNVDTVFINGYSSILQNV